MHLTVHTDYALRVLFYLALSDDELATISDIAEYYGISKNHLVKIVHKLAQEGLVLTVRGRAGGIKLADDPQNIRLGDIVRVTEPGFAMVNCKSDDGFCRVLPVCGLPKIFREATNAFLGEIDKYTLADALRKRISLDELKSELTAGSS
ncbi:MAG: Rrf2 family transcriptional regulator [Gammaproteobacteria bacterium]|nr:Rrf2 family transcriptional regulator [Gammaproteobacteria bacterium]